MYETDCDQSSPELSFTDKCWKAAFRLSAAIVAISVISAIVIIFTHSNCKF